LNKLQESEEFQACEAGFLVDNCSLHMSDDTLAVVARARMTIITFAPYTTHIFQMLDVVLFDSLKKHATGFETLDEEQPAAAFLLKVYHDFKQTLIEVNIWEAFVARGFTYDIKQNTYGRLFDEEKLRQSLGFVEQWKGNAPLESLLKARREAKSRWINKPE
jgi:hypothetical protein